MHWFGHDSGRGGWRLKTSDRPPNLRSFGLGLVALLLVMVGMEQVRAAVWMDAVLLVGGGLLLWLWRFGGEAIEVRPLVGVTRLGLPRWWLGSVFALVAIGLAVWNWRKLNVEFPTDADWLWYLATIGVLLVAALTMEPWRADRLARTRLSNVVWALMAVVIFGAVVRLVALDSLPFGTWYDEAANGLEALRMAREPAYRPIYTDGVNSAGHYLWLIVGAFKLFGENTFAVRSISAVMGILTIVAAYLAGRELHDEPLGLVWAILVAMARWSITFSRLGMYNSATPLFELLTLYWLLRGLRRGSPLDFTLAGVAVGLGLCFYSAFQLFVAVGAVFFLVIAWKERARWRTLWTGLAISVLAAAIVIAPIAKYAVTKPESYFSRVQTTSLFTGKSSEERVEALWANAQKHLLMFNVRGDPNGRHNLPGEPMLDWVSGGLLVVGLLICLIRIRSPQYAFVPAWILVGLLGGILSLDFEAPQSLRAIAALPAVLLAAALPATQLIEEWRRGAGRYLPQAGFWIVAALLLLPASVANLQTYFVRQARDFASWNAHSTPETITAHLLREADPAVAKYVISLYDGHPTVRFLAPGVSYSRIETNTTLPLLREMPNGMMMILDIERRELYEETRRLYPGAVYEEVRPPGNGPAVVYVNKLSGQDLQSVQGLMGSYQSGEGDSAFAQVRKDLAIDFEWPAASPVQGTFHAEWQGVLAVNTYGPYQFFIEAPGEVSLWVGEQLVIQGDAGNGLGLGGGLLLARGNHTIRLDIEGGDGRVRLAWQPPDGPPATVPSWALYVPPVQSNGLLGRYFASGDWSGEAAFAQIDPRLSIYFHVPILPRPYTVEWSGKLAIPESGHYDFALQSIDEAALHIDGVEVVASRVRNEMAVGGLTLEAGLHDVVVRYADRTDHTYIDLSWRPPGLDISYRTIPSELLFPPRANYDQVNVGDLARFMQSETILPTAAARQTVSPATVEVVAAGLEQPRGVALLDGVVYVAEAGGQRIVAFDAASGDEIASSLDSIAFVEPFDLAAQPDGSLAILDAGSGQLLRFEPATGEVQQLPVTPQYLERSRGIGAGLADEIWIANTPGQRLVAVDGSGAPIYEIAMPAVAGDQEMQPVDVVAMADNTVFVTDVAGHMLYRFSVAGYLLSSQPIPVANALDGAHLATDAAGAVYMTEPESGNVVRLDANGIVTDLWSVRTPDSMDAKPVGIAVASDGVIWVVDSQGGKLLRVIPQGEE